jgi:flagellar protein FlaG
MSAETFTTALFLITAVIAGGVLINAVFPVVYTMTGTFQSATHESDVRLRTDFKIINTFASGSAAQVWMKNIGSARIPLADIERSDVFCGEVGNFDHLTYTTGSAGNGQWEVDFGPQYDLNNNGYWDPGETVQVTAVTSTIPSSGGMVYYLFTLPNGVLRSTEFTAS